MFADTKNIPVYAFIEDVGASGDTKGWEMFLDT